MERKVKPARAGLKGNLTVPPDKSISHRAVMFGAVSNGKLRVSNFLFGEDCMRTFEAFRAMGVKIEREDNALVIHGVGLKGLTSPPGPLYMGNSGTSMRIISGILAGQNFDTKLTGDESLSARPMRRIIDPLKLMGANIGTLKGNFPPISIKAAEGPLKPAQYTTPIPSAQVKSCVLAAGLYADGTTSVKEIFQSRDHTERMLEYFSANITRKGLTTEITGGRELEPKDIEVPGDISSAAFFMIAALIVEGSDLTIRNVGLNPTRDGILKVLERMGADIEVLDLRGEVEPAGDIRVRTSDLKGTVIRPEEIPLLIDEVPVLIVAAVTAEGETRIQGISELRVKETDRIKSMTNNFSKLGIKIVEEGDTLIINGGCKKFSAADLDSYGDHRTAMAMAMAALVSDGECLIRDTDCVKTSYPGFFDDLQNLIS
ncbi:MAG: 3-phosphoshikimate 1-carboxyvinyltransferase [Candidatus Omnitrophota bacterium]